MANLQFFKNDYFVNKVYSLNMNKHLKKYGLLILAFITCIILNYNPHMMFKTSYQHWGWNLSLLASILVIIIMKKRDPDLWKQKLGIAFSKKDYLIFSVTTILLLITSYFLVGYVSRLNGFLFKPQLFFYKEYFSPDLPFHAILANYLYYIPETFNEEMLVGAVLLMGLERNFSKLGKTNIAIIVALIFFPGLYVNRSTNNLANEPERFNIVFGNLSMTVATSILTI